MKRLFVAMAMPLLLGGVQTAQAVGEINICSTMICGSLSASAASVPVGGSVTVNWSVATSGLANYYNWVGLYPAGAAVDAPWNSSIPYRYVFSTATSGSVTFTSLPSGNFQLRLFNNLDKFLVSPGVPLTVGGIIPPPPPPSADITPPSTVASLATTVINTTQINLSWPAATDNVGVTGYKLERCTGVGCTAFTEIATSTVTSYNNVGLTSGTTYGYRVRAVDAAGNVSGYSPVASAKTYDVSICATLACGTVSANATKAGFGTQVKVDWTVSASNAYNWVGLYRVGAPDAWNGSIPYRYTGAGTSGSITDFTVVSSGEGIYEFRLFGANNARIAVSGPITISGIVSVF